MPVDVRGIVALSYEIPPLQDSPTEVGVRCIDAGIENGHYQSGVAQLTIPGALGTDIGEEPLPRVEGIPGAEVSCYCCVRLHISDPGNRR